MISARNVASALGKVLTAAGLLLAILWAYAASLDHMGPAERRAHFPWDPHEVLTLGTGVVGAILLVGLLIRFSLPQRWLWILAALIAGIYIATFIIPLFALSDFRLGLELLK